MVSLIFPPFCEPANKYENDEWIGRRVNHGGRYEQFAQVKCANAEQRQQEAQEDGHE